MVDIRQFGGFWSGLFKNSKILKLTWHRVLLFFLSFMAFIMIILDKVTMNQSIAFVVIIYILPRFGDAKDALESRVKKRSNQDAERAEFSHFVNLRRSELSAENKEDSKEQCEACDKARNDNNPKGREPKSN